MRLEPDTLHELSRLAQAAALRAGRLIARRRGDFGQPEYKSESSSLAANIVTEVDRESQRIIVATLAPSLARNELGLLAEESADDGSRFEKDHFWCVDPLDGTLQFSENQPGFAVSIALVSRSGQSPDSSLSSLSSAASSSSVRPSASSETAQSQEAHDHQNQGCTLHT